MKSALGKKRRDGEHAPLQPLTKMQRVHIGQLVEKYGDDYRVGCQFLFLDLYNVCGGCVTPFDFFFAEDVYGHEAKCYAAFSCNSREVVRKIPYA